MTPQGILGNPQAAPSANSNVYNQVSLMGMNGQEQAEVSKEQPQMESLTEKATKEFGAMFNSFITLTESYPGADKEKVIAQNALANWFSKIANSINESGSNSTY